MEVLYPSGRKSRIIQEGMHKFGGAPVLILVLWVMAVPQQPEISGATTGLKYK